MLRIAAASYFIGALGVVRPLHHVGFDPSQADDLHALLTSLADRGPTADDRLAARNVEP